MGFYKENREVIVLVDEISFMPKKFMEEVIAPLVDRTSTEQESENKELLSLEFTPSETVSLSSIEYDLSDDSTDEDTDIGYTNAYYCALQQEFNKEQRV